MSAHLRRWIVVALLALLLALAVESVQAQDATATPEGSTSQLSLGYEPTLGLKLMIADSALRYFSASGYGGGPIFISVGSPCPNGYTNVVSSLGTVWAADTGPVDFRFESTQPGANVGIFLYNMLTNQWTCTLQFAPTGILHLDTVPKGVFFIWILTDQPGAVSGNFTIDASQPAAAPTAEATVQQRGRK